MILILLKPIKTLGDYKMAVTLSGPSYPASYSVPAQEIPQYDLRIDVEQDQFATPSHLPNGCFTVVLLDTIGRYKAGIFSHLAISIRFIKNTRGMSEAMYARCVELGTIGRLQIVDNKIQSILFGKLATNKIQANIQEFMLGIGQDQFALDHVIPSPKSAADDQYKIFCTKMLSSLKQSGLIN